jgi:Mrp family chromosome partitioning ATPase
VIVLDCDLRRRSLNAALKADVKFGLTDVISGDKTVEEARYIDLKSGVEYLLLPRAQLATARSPLDLPQFDALLAQLREAYDHVILDTPPLLPIVDTRKLAKKVDSVVLLCRWQSTPRRAVQHSIRLLQDVGAEIGGLALTRIDLKAQQRYGYGDSSYYYQGYSDYLEGQTAE